MTMQQGYFITNLRGMKAKHREAVSSLSTSREPFDTSLQVALKKLRKKGNPSGDMWEGAAICSVLSKTDGDNSDTAAKLWTAYVADILAASKHPDDPEYSHIEWTKSLLVELSPSAMTKALASYPPPKAVGRILQIIRNRLYDPDKHPPLRMAILGGAETEGQGCEVASVDVPKGSIMANPMYCSWPYRFEQLVNTMLGGNKVIEVTNLAEDGTDTSFMTPLLRNWMYPSSLLPHGPDVVVNAYKSKDYSRYGAITSVDTIRSEMEAFVSGVEGSNPCGEPPLIVHLDDSSLTDPSTVGKNHVLVLQYNVPMAKVIKADKATRRIPEHLQFGMAGHAAMSWMLTFALSDMIIHHCSSSRAKSQVAAVGTRDSKCKGPVEAEKPCTFSWFAGPMGTVTKPSQIQQYISPYIIENSGWQVSTDMSTGFSRKSGLVATETGAKVVFHLKDIAKDIRYINLITLKSNAEEWYDGKAKFALLVNDKTSGNDWVETSFEITGGHQSPTHITYHFEVDLKENGAKVGSDVMLKVESVGASSFKILGMMLCS